MGRKADLSDDEKSSIRTLVEQGYQFKQIGIILKRDSTAVSKYWNKYNNESISKRTGRKRSYSEA
jgi:predicted transcriptional regulator